LTRRLIEQWLPAQALGAENQRERATLTALPPLFALHVWWARRPLTASRAAVVASLLPAWPNLEDTAANAAEREQLARLQAEFPGGEAEYRAWYLQALGILGDPVAARAVIAAARAAGTTTSGNAYGYDRAFTLSPDEKTVDRIHRLARLCSDSDGAPVVLDPFAGGGSIPFEAARYGCATIANELNPVATAILTGTVELPARLGTEFASVINLWGDRWAASVRKRLEPYFPLEHTDERPAFIWAHSVPCPTTGRPTPLAPDFWLARGTSGRDVAVRLDVDRAAGTYQLLIVEGAEAREQGPRSTYKRGAAESIWTGETFSGDYIRRMGAESRIGQMLLAVSVTRPGRSGRQFRAPTAADLDAVEGAIDELARRRPAWEIVDLVPAELIPDGWKTSEPRRIGLEI
jgi:adenine-specific DNA methylase